MRSRTQVLVHALTLALASLALGASTSQALTIVTFEGLAHGRIVDTDFAAQGITLVGRLLAAENGILEIAPDLADSLASGDRAYAGFLDLVDTHIAQHKLDMPEEPEARAMQPDPPDLSTPLRHLDLRAAGIGSVIWSTGYACDFGWIDLPVFAQGEPIHRDGVTAVPGLYFIGLQWLSRMNSSFLSGVGQDAGRDKPDAADPVHEREHVQNPGDDEIVHDGLLQNRAREPGLAARVAPDTE